ncbi:spermine synthase-like isoform X2 [Ornithodoros turicata]
MTVLTAMVDIWLDRSICSNPTAKASAVQSIECILSTLCLVRQHDIEMPGFHVFLYAAPSLKRSCVVNIYSSGFTTITVEDGSNDSPLTNQVMEEMKQKLKKTLQSRMEKIPLIKRGAPVPNYYTTSDERILEYDFDKIVFESDSKYQHVKILHSPTLGNCLLLDDMQNLAEKDINYTHGLMNYKQICYKDKEILILGGGDGGLLHELLKEKPKHVTMVDIDEMVISACRDHLRGACGDVLDSMVGKNYEIIIDDCMNKMKDYIEEGRLFDIVFNDLTDFPISSEPQAITGGHWDFVRKIVNMSMKVLRQNGRLLNHAIGVSCPSSLETYEKLLKSLPVNVEFTKHSDHVPSFMEEWVFYEIRKLE